MTVRQFTITVMRYFSVPFCMHLMIVKWTIDKSPQYCYVLKLHAPAGNLFQWTLA